jgi:hypothetical protein
VNNENIFEVIENYIPKAWENDKNIFWYYPREEEYEFEIWQDFEWIEFVLNKILLWNFLKKIFKNYKRNFLKKCINWWDYNEDFPVILTEEEVKRFYEIISWVNEDEFYKNIDVFEMSKKEVYPYYKIDEKDFWEIKNSILFNFKVLKNIYFFASKYNCRVIVYYG